MSTLYHGTTRENWENIQKEGWLGNSHEPVWNCSMREVYFFDVSKADRTAFESGILTESEKQQLMAEGSYGLIHQTFEQAQIAAAVQNYQGNELVVLRFEVPDEFITDDYSCENADESVTVDVEDMCQAELTGVYIDTDYNPCLRLFYISSLMANNDFLNMQSFSELEIKAARLINSNECYIDDLFCHEWETELETATA